MATELEHAEITGLLEAPKSFAGRPAWRASRGGNVVYVTALLVVDGTVRPDVVFHANSVVHLLEQPLTLLFTFADMPVERLDVIAAKPHLNKLDRRTPASLRGIVLPAGTNHLHTWADNRRWWPDGNLPVAQAIAFDNAPASVIRFALARWNILDALVIPPHTPRLDL